MKVLFLSPVAFAVAALIYPESRADLVTYQNTTDHIQVLSPLTVKSSRTVYRETWTRTGLYYGDIGTDNGDHERDYVPSDIPEDERITFLDFVTLAPGDIYQYDDGRWTEESLWSDFMQDGSDEEQSTGRWITRWHQDLSQETFESTGFTFVNP